MLIVKHTLESSASPTQIWRVWEDVESWKTWDDEIEFSRLHGPFKAGTTASLKMLNSPVLDAQITQCVPLKMYVFEARLFFAKSVSTSIVEKRDDRIWVTFIVEISGPLAFFYSLLIGRAIKKKTPREMQQMLKKAVAMSDVELT